MRGRSGLLDRLYAISFKVLGHMQPRLGAVIAKKLWFRVRPARQTTSQRHVAPPKHAVSFQRQSNLRWRGPRVAMWQVGEGVPLLLVHGWGGDHRQWQPWIAPARQRGFAIHALDLPGHGASAGHRCHLFLAAEALRSACAQTGASVVVGYSFGAAAAVQILRMSVKLKRLALLAPPVFVDEHVNKFMHDWNFTSPLRQAFLHSLVETLGPDWVTLARAHSWVGEYTLPVRIYHAPNDTVVPFREAEALDAAWPSARLIRKEGTGHGRLVRQQEVITETLDFLRGIEGRTD